MATVPGEPVRSGGLDLREGGGRAQGMDAGGRDQQAHQGCRPARCATQPAPLRPRDRPCSRPKSSHRSGDPGIRAARRCRCVHPRRAAALPGSTARRHCRDRPVCGRRRGHRDLPDRRRHGGGQRPIGSKRDGARWHGNRPHNGLIRESSPLINRPFTPPACPLYPSRVSTLPLPRVHFYPPACPLLPSGAYIFSPLVSVSGVDGAKRHATLDTRHSGFCSTSSATASQAIDQAGPRMRQKPNRCAIPSPSRTRQTRPRAEVLLSHISCHPHPFRPARPDLTARTTSRTSAAWEAGCAARAGTPRCAPASRSRRPPRPWPRLPA